MKKIIVACAAAICSVSAFAANNATNTIALTVPPIMSVQAVPDNQAYTMTEADLMGTKTFTPVRFTMRSNDAYRIMTEYSSSYSFTNNSSDADKDNSKAAFRAAMEFARSTDNLYYPLGLLETLAPFNEPANNGTYPHTNNAGVYYDYNAKITNLAFNAVPGVYTARLKVTISQP